MPAGLALTWAPENGSQDFNDKDNWVETSDHSVAAPRAPEAGDDVTFDGMVSSGICDDLGTLVQPPGGGLNASLVVPNAGGSGSATGLNSLNLINNYAGTVDVIAPLQVGTFNMNGAATSAIAQLVSNGSDITVTSAFTWTDGTLNSSTNQANLNLNGAVATVTPLAAGTIATRDNFIATNLASISFNPGTIVWDGGSGINLTSSQMFVNADTPQGGKANINFNGDDSNFNINDEQIKLYGGSIATVTGPGTWTDSKHQLQNLGGTLEIQKNAIATLNGVTQAGAWTLIQSSGTLKLHTGSTLNVMGNSGMSLSGGTLNIVADSPQGATASAVLGLTANTGKLSVSGSAIITFSTPANGWWAAGRQLYWTFEVQGDVNWNGGTYSPRVDGTSLGTDTFKIDGALTLGNGATMTITPVSYNVPPAGLPGTGQWTVIMALKGINSPAQIVTGATTPKYKTAVNNIAGTNETDINLVPGG